MANFEEAFAHLMRDEGGWVKHPSDPGGETYKGITRKNFGDWPGWKVIDTVKAGLGPEPQTYGTEYYRGWVKELNLRLSAIEWLQMAVRSFYMLHFWIYPYSAMTDQCLVNFLFGMGVNTGLDAKSGRSTPHRWLQSELGVEDDGIIGPATLTAALKYQGEAPLLDAVKARARSFYRDLAARNESKQVFLNGWLARVDRG